ncbi:MAG: hypothetical protein ICV73_24390 [Acetobacteraceae bacterium]|nr:hypothetical protein [Acetobacteraceae bacterium]
MPMRHSAIPLAAAAALAVLAPLPAPGQGASGCHAGPRDRPPLGWRRIKQGDAATQYLDFDSFCRRGRDKEATVMTSWRAPGPAAAGPQYPPYRSTVERVRFQCGPEPAGSPLHTTVYEDPNGTGKALFTAPQRLERRPISSETITGDYYAYVCARDNAEDVVWGGCSFGPCADLNPQKYGWRVDSP